MKAYLATIHDCRTCPNCQGCNWSIKTIDKDKGIYAMEIFVSCRATGNESNRAFAGKSTDFIFPDDCPLEDVEEMK